MAPSYGTLVGHHYAQGYGDASAALALIHALASVRCNARDIVARGRRQGSPARRLWIALNVAKTAARPLESDARRFCREVREDFVRLYRVAYAEESSLMARRRRAREVPPCSAGDTGCGLDPCECRYPPDLTDQLMTMHGPRLDEVEAEFQRRLKETTQNTTKQEVTS